ncbi:MAG: hypothetical protein DRG87_11975 [Deltaproteobacteria bacterium]|nr:MAG: hypothetical protein DRG87_11975 [Deltaproteobacteria bacterium]
MYYLHILTLVALVISLILSREKTLKAAKIALTRFLAIFPAFLTMIILVSVVLFFVPDKLISHYLGSDNIVTGVLCGALFGSITLMPGFIAFPLCGILLKKGVLYMVLSAFSTTLMMVGVLTYPIEKAYFGTRVTILRNSLSFLIALVVALMTGFFFGEIF